MAAITSGIEKSKEMTSLAAYVIIICDQTDNCAFW